MQTAQTEIIARVRGYVHENFLYMHSHFQLGDNDRLLDEGVIDPMAIVEVISFIESEFGIRATEDEVSEVNFGSLSAIARFVCEKRAVLAS
jgi:acyl carrier protein